MTLFLSVYAALTFFTMAFVFDPKDGKSSVEWCASFLVGLIWWFFWPFRAGVAVRKLVQRLHD